MKHTFSFALGLFALSFMLPSLAQEKKQEQQVEQLLKQLNDDEWKVREEATRKLIELWEDDAVKKRVEETLEKAGKEKNAEVKDRCERIREGIATRRALGKELVKALGVERVEELEGKNKLEWVSVIGKCLKEKPEFLSAEQKKALARDILKEQKVVDELKQKYRETTREARPVEECWFYLQALEHTDTEVCQCAALALGDMGMSMQLGGDLVKEITRAVLARLKHEDAGVRSAVAYGLLRMSDHLEGKLLEESLSITETALKKEEDKNVRLQLDSALTALKQRKQELEEKKK